MKVNVLPDLTAVDAAVWNGLLAQSAVSSVFLSWEWPSAWARTFAEGRAVELLTWRADDGSIGALLPPYEERDGSWRVVGGANVSDYLDLIAPAGTEEEAWHALLQHRALHGLKIRILP